MTLLSAAAPISNLVLVFISISFNPERRPSGAALACGSRINEANSLGD
jgi:hypothetical protein